MLSEHIIYFRSCLTTFQLLLYHVGYLSSRRGNNQGSFLHLANPCLAQGKRPMPSKLYCCRKFATCDSYCHPVVRRDLIHHSPSLRGRRTKQPTLHHPLLLHRQPSLPLRRFHCLYHFFLFSHFINPFSHCPQHQSRNPFHL